MAPREVQRVFIGRECELRTSVEVWEGQQNGNAPRRWGSIADAARATGDGAERAREFERGVETLGEIEEWATRGEVTKFVPRGWAATMGPQFRKVALVDQIQIPVGNQRVGQLSAVGRSPDVPRSSARGASSSAASSWRQ